MFEPKAWYYRFVDGSYENNLTLEVLPVLRTTPKGVWIKYWDGKELFVLADPAGKRFAYASKADALRSYIIRKERQIQHAQATINRARSFLETAKQVKL